MVTIPILQGIKRNRYLQCPENDDIRDLIKMLETNYIFLNLRIIKQLRYQASIQIGSLKTFHLTPKR